ncbi:MAG TPA: 4-hydroxy-3-methylbut-2-enyl diphosphate reductase [Verrucomicrobiae bacterium]|nr:4-hydroxy-3-methylbut-2-enyl diphosphate reductase [Verrucomicrobiae bacterium]
MKILKAEHLGMCFGVRDAIALAREEAAQRPVTILGQLVHNPTVLHQLAAEGVAFAESPGEVKTPTAIITAHGASDSAIARARMKIGNVLEATCPLVHVAHRAVHGLVRDGFHPVIIGKRGHVEVRGLTEDLEDFDIVLSEEDVGALRPRAKFGIAAQTTQPIERVRYLCDLIGAKFPDSEVKFVDTVCQPTKLRQKAATDLAARVDVMIVIGGRQSNNTRELAETCRKRCARVHQVETAHDLQPDWFANCEAVGVTAGTSTPDDVIHGVESRLQELACEQQWVALAK